MPTSDSPLQKSHALAEILSQPEVCLSAFELAQSSPAFQFTVEHASRHLSRVVILDGAH